MWFIGVEVEQETSAPPPKKKSWIRPWLTSRNSNCYKTNTNFLCVSYSVICEGCSLL